MHYHLKNLEIKVWLGVYESEKEAPQRVLVNAWFEADTQLAAESDDLADTIDYALVEKFIRDFAGETHFELLERLHTAMLQGLQQQFAALKKLQLSIEKFPFENGSVVISN